MDDKISVCWPVAVSELAITVLISMTAFLYPNDWTLPIPLASVFGPALGIRMGFGECLVLALICGGLMTPIAFRQNAWTILLLALGICLWLFSGYAASQWLYA